MKYIKEYMDSMGKTCPYCNKQAIDWDDRPDIYDDGKAFTVAYCSNCGEIWHMEFVLALPKKI